MSTLKSTLKTIFNTTAKLVPAFITLAATTSWAEPIVSEDGLHTFDDDIFISVPLDPGDSNSEIIQLPANIHLPVSNDPEPHFPLIVFVNSWALNEAQYAPKARQFASDGYAVLSYTTRGFRGAPGRIDTAGPNDVVDMQAAISYALDNYSINENAIGLSGISYGSGISLLTALIDERVTAVVPMSTWGSLIDALWAGETPNYTWLEILVDSGKLTGRLDPIVSENYKNMRLHQNIPPTIAWGKVRSPVEYLHIANNRDRKPAIYVSNNLHDYLFQPNTIIELLSQYQGPWRIDLNFGTHGQGESGGIIGDNTSNYPWRNAKAWFDHYLKGIDNGIETLKPVNTIIKSRSAFLPNERESFDQFPVTDSADDLVLHLNPGSAFSADKHPGKLKTTEYSRTKSIKFNTEDSAVNTGHVLGAVAGTDRDWSLEEIDPTNSLVFMSEGFPEGLYLRGASTLEFWAEVSNSTQYFAYLLDYDPFTERANFVGHGPLTWHRPEGDTVDPLEPVKLTLEFYWTAHDLNPGHSLVLVIDGEDPDYWRYEDEIATPKQNTMVFSAQQQAILRVPRIKEPAIFTSLNDPQGLESDPSRSANGTGSGYRPSGGSISVFTVLMLGLISLLRKIQVISSKRDLI